MTKEMAEIASTRCLVSFRRELTVFRLCIRPHIQCFEQLGSVISAVQVSNCVSRVLWSCFLAIVYSILSSPTENMDDLLEFCFFCALLRTKKITDPILTSAFFRSYVLPSWWDKFIFFPALVFRCSSAILSSFPLLLVFLYSLPCSPFCSFLSFFTLFSFNNRLSSLPLHLFLYCSP